MQRTVPLSKVWYSDNAHQHQGQGHKSSKQSQGEEEEPGAEFAAGLGSPFDPGRIEEVYNTLENALS